MRKRKYMFAAVTLVAILTIALAVAVLSDEAGASGSWTASPATGVRACTTCHAGNGDVHGVGAHSSIYPSNCGACHTGGNNSTTPEPAKCAACHGGVTAIVAANTHATEGCNSTPGCHGVATTTTTAAPTTTTTAAPTTTTTAAPTTTTTAGTTTTTAAPTTTTTAGTTTTTAAPTTTTTAGTTTTTAAPTTTTTAGTTTTTAAPTTTTTAGTTTTTAGTTRTTQVRVTAGVTVRVTDDDKRPIERAFVMLRARGHHFAAFTDSAGRVQFGSVPYGTYKTKVLAPRFVRFKGELVVGTPTVELLVKLTSRRANGHHNHPVIDHGRDGKPDRHGDKYDRHERGDRHVPRD